MPHDLFVSHASSNATDAWDLCTALEGVGLKCWIAPRDVPTGEDYPAAIARAVRECRVLIVLVTEAANRSRPVMKEIELAQRFGRSVMPVFSEKVELSDALLFLLGTSQWFDAAQPPFAQHFPRLIRDIQHMLSNRAPAAAGKAESISPDRKVEGEPATKSPPQVAHRKPLWLLAGLALLTVAAGVFLVKYFAAPTHVASTPASPVPEKSDGSLAAAIRAAVAIEQRGDAVETVSAWLRLCRQFPEAKEPKWYLDLAITPLRSSEVIKTPEAFAPLKPLLVEAAQLDSLPAVLALAYAARPVDRRESFNWFSVAAARGDVDAHLNMGLLLSDGLGDAPDFEKAFYYFSFASEAGDSRAMSALAECYLSGKGTATDLETGVSWLKKGVAKGDLHSMNRLAYGYNKGIFGLPVDQSEAFRLWKKVTETKANTDWNRKAVSEAYGNLGVLHMNGDGVGSNQKQAAQFFQEGVALGDAYSMYLLGKCYLDGIGVPKSPSEALNLMRRAAAAGSRPAQNWCRTNSVTFEEK